LRSEWSGDGGGEDLRGEFKRVERGWCLGGEEVLQHHPALGLDRRALEHGQSRAFGVPAPTARERLTGPLLGFGDHLRARYALKTRLT
jgi:hypothetical protein